MIDIDPSTKLTTSQSKIKVLESFNSSATVFHTRSFFPRASHSGDSHENYQHLSSVVFCSELCSYVGMWLTHHRAQVL